MEQKKNVKLQSHHYKQNCNFHGLDRPELFYFCELLAAPVCPRFSVHTECVCLKSKGVAKTSPNESQLRAARDTGCLPSNPEPAREPTRSKNTTRKWKKHKQNE